MFLYNGTTCPDRCHNPSNSGRIETKSASKSKGKSFSIMRIIPPPLPDGAWSRPLYGPK